MQMGGMHMMAASPGVNLAQPTGFMGYPATQPIMNPMMQMVPLAGGGISYQNPNHHALSQNFAPMIPDKGPSQESWYRDGLDMGKKLGS
jgi:hypothetical protein